MADERDHHLLRSAGTLTDVYEALIDGLDVIPRGSEAHLGQVGGQLVRRTQSLTRPADTTAYALYDTIAGSTTAANAPLWYWDGLARAPGGSGLLAGAMLITDQVANVSTYDLMLFRQPITQIADNVEGTLLLADTLHYVATLSFPALVKPTTNSTVAFSHVPSFNVGFSCASGRSGLFGLLRTTLSGGFTPASGQLYRIHLIVYPD